MDSRKHNQVAHFKNKKPAVGLAGSGFTDPVTDEFLQDACSSASRPLAAWLASCTDTLAGDRAH
jgi:hypothetical protein